MGVGGITITQRGGSGVNQGGRDISCGPGKEPPHDKDEGDKTTKSIA